MRFESLEKDKVDIEATFKDANLFSLKCGYKQMEVTVHGIYCLKCVYVGG